MTKKLLLTFALLISLTTLAQVGIGTTNPDSSTILDVQSSSKGMLIPQIALTSTTDNVTITNPANSLLIYNTAEVNDVTSGYYFRQGNKWVRIINENDNRFWSKSGNTGTTVGTNFIGTTDLEDFAIYSNNTEAIRVKNNGNVGIGITNPGEQLEVNEGMTINSGSVLPRRYGVWSVMQLSGANGSAWSSGYLHVKTNIDPSLINLMFVLHFNGFDYGNGSNIIDSYFSGYAWTGNNNLVSSKINNVFGTANRVSINRWYKSSDNKICIVLYSPQWYFTTIQLDVSTVGATNINTVSVLNSIMSATNLNVY